MSTKWRTLPFGEVFADRTGGNIKTQQKDYYEQGDFAIIDQGKSLIAGYTNDVGKLCHCELPAIVFGDHTRVLKYVDFPFCLGADGTKVLSPQIKANVKYLYHYLQQLRIPDAGYDRHFKYLKRSEIVLPPLTEQKRIAAILDQADGLRRKRLISLELTDTLSQAIFDQMFGHLPTTGANNREVTLADIVRNDDQINYGVVQPGEEFDGGVPLIRVANVVSDGFSSDRLKKIDPMIEAQYKRSRLRGDEVLIACVGSIGAVALATPDLANANIARAVARIPVDHEKADRVYVAEFLKLGRTQEYFRTETRTVAQPTLNIKQISETRIPIPPVENQRKFADRVAKVAQTRSALLLHLSKLNLLFSSLQHRAFTGELTSKNL